MKIDINPADQPVIALAGNPNSGKTTLFNRLTGARQHVGNYPGITVDKKEGFFTTRDNRDVRIIDLPGTYSLTAYSEEEIVARDFLVRHDLDVVINIVDASNLQRNLYLTVQLMELGCRVILALNMIDLAKNRGMEIDVKGLSSMLGIPAYPIIARRGTGVNELMDAAVSAATDKTIPQPLYISYGDDMDNALSTMEEIVKENNFLGGHYPSRWLCVKYLEEDSEMIARGNEADAETSAKLLSVCKNLNLHLKQTLGVNAEAVIADHRYGFIKSILANRIIKRSYSMNRLYASDRIDQVLTNRFAGPVIMLCVLLGLYQFTFSLSEGPVEMLGNLFSWLSASFDVLLPDGLLKSMIISGIIDGVGGVMGFVPLIMLMFFGIAILEDSGYLARVAFMMDRVFRIFGLHGSSVMAFIVSGGLAGGCAVPGVMATRTLRSRKERMATLLTVPFMNCGAKIPVLALLTGTFFSSNQAVVMFLLTLLAWCVALLAAKVLRLTVLPGESTPFVMELPPYRLPTVRGLMIHTWERTWQYMKKAGTVILAISIILWAMMTFPGLSDKEKAPFQAERNAVYKNLSPEEISIINNTTPSSEISEKIAAAKERLQSINSREAAAAIRHSIAGRAGIAMEGITRNLTGFDWRTNIALLGGIAAKEVIISTLGTAYSIGNISTEASSSLSETLAHNPDWNPIKAFSVIIFVMFYAPCFVTVVCIVRESGSWKWGLFSVLFNTTVAFMLSSAVYQIGNLI